MKIKNIRKLTLNSISSLTWILFSSALLKRGILKALRMMTTWLAAGSSRQNLMNSGSRRAVCLRLLYSREPGRANSRLNAFSSAIAVRYRTWRAFPH